MEIEEHILHFVQDLSVDLILTLLGKKSLGDQPGIGDSIELCPQCVLARGCRSLGDSRSGSRS